MEEDKTKVAAELREWINERISELQSELEKLKEMQSFVDSYLKQTAFKPASEFIQQAEEIPEIREIKRDRTGELVATAKITSNTLIVEPVQAISLKTETPPFKSFFLNKILSKMRSDDDELVSSGKLKKGQELRFRIEEKEGIITRIVIENYREKSRLNELLSTLTWTFSRMLEK